MRGHVEGTRVLRIDERDIACPLLRRDALHLWPANFPNDSPQVSFGLGFGVGTH